MKTEYPRMQLKRDTWLNLNGEWDFEFDDENIGQKEKWYKKDSFTKKIQVPFSYQTQKSGINEQKFHDHIWYLKKFSLNDDFHNKETLLNFEAVDYFCIVYLNGEMVGSHEGGNVGFTIDITNYLCKENTLVVYVNDPSEDETIPRGKQFWEEESRSIWYTRTSGIWQTVWLEPVSYEYISSMKMTPDIDKGTLDVEINFNKSIKNGTVMTEVTLKNELIQNVSFKIFDSSIKFTLDIFKNKIMNTSFHGNGNCWSPESPTLYDINVTLTSENKDTDTISSYFGMRKIHKEKGMIFLNNKRYYQKLILDQGYWPESLLTSPSDLDLQNDIILSKEMGFNGCRKHQKIEESRFLYWADKLGYIVWEEMPSFISYDTKSVERASKEWMEAIKRDYNHPCIVTWVPLNESWGVPNISRFDDEKSFSMALYYLTHSLDKTRLVISNDGWEMTKTDICAIHNYSHGQLNEPKVQSYFSDAVKSKQNLLGEMSADKNIFVKGFESQDVPIMLTEVGGFAFDSGNEKIWGYSTVSSKEEFIGEYKRVIENIFESDSVFGFCFTQLTDVENEINGLLTYDRKPKVELSYIKDINNSRFKKTVI